MKTKKDAQMMKTKKDAQMMKSVVYRYPTHFPFNGKWGCKYT